MYTKNSISYSFTPKEQRIRRMWLWLTLILPNLFIAGFMLLEFFVDELSMAAILINLGALGAYAFFSWIWYESAYKSPGTKLLTLSMVMLGLGFFGILRGLIKETDSRSLSLFILGLQVVDFWVNFKMREINKRIKLLIIVTAAKLAIPKIKHCWDPKNLHQVFSDTIQFYPICEPLLSDEFKKRQALFNKISEKDTEILDLAKQEFRETLASISDLNIDSFEWLLEQMPELKADVENHLRTVK